MPTDIYDIAFRTTTGQILDGYSFEAPSPLKAAAIAADWVVNELDMTVPHEASLVGASVVRVVNQWGETILTLEK
jgi:hypothetical protein